MSKGLGAAFAVVSRAAVVLSFVACGDAAPADVDADADAGVVADDAQGATDCWPIETSTPGGSVELGTGRDFASLGAEDTLQFIDGNQGGTYLELHAAIEGLDPGIATDPTSLANPKTMFHAILFDGTRIGPNCPGRVGYEPIEGDRYQRARQYLMEFLPYDVGEKAFDTEVTLVVEVIDVEGRYARDERTVLCRAPDETPSNGVDE